MKFGKFRNSVFKSRKLDLLEKIRDFHYEPWNNLGNLAIVFIYLNDFPTKNSLVPSALAYYKLFRSFIEARILGAGILITGKFIYGLL